MTKQFMGRLSCNYARRTAYFFFNCVALIRVQFVKKTEGGVFLKHFN